MAYDLSKINQARELGYSDDEIADFLAPDIGADKLKMARESGYSGAEILGHLLSSQVAPAAATVAAREAGGGRGFVNPTMPTSPRKGTMRGAAPYVPQEEYNPRVELPSGVKPSDAGGGRGSVNPLPAAVSRSDSPFKNKQEAIDDAVDRIELGTKPSEVFAEFAKMGVSRQEIEARGTQLGGKKFAPDARPVTVRYGAAEAGDTSISPVETSNTEELVNIGKRGVLAASAMKDAGLYQAGAIDSSTFAEKVRINERKKGAVSATGDIEAGMEALQEANKSGSMSEVAGVIFTGPGFKAFAAMLAESAIPSMMAMPAAVAGFAAGGPIGGAAAAGATSAAMEFAGALGEVMQDAKINMSDPVAVRAALEDPELMAKVKDRGIKRGLAVGIADALSAGFAGRFLSAANKAIKAGGVTSARGALVAAAAKEGGVQAGFAAAGEGAGQALVGEYKPLDLLMETVADMPGSAVEVASGAVSRGALQAAPTPASAPDASPVAPVTVESMPTTPITPDQLAPFAAQGQQRQAEQQAQAQQQQATEQQAQAQVEQAPITPVDIAAHQAATSPLNELPQPTDEQKKSGDYVKGDAVVGVVPVRIENAAGTDRTGKDADGVPWSTNMKDHYGEVEGTKGADGDGVDIFIKRGTAPDHAGPVFVIDQIDPKTGKFDEHKAMHGFDSEAEALQAYQRNYNENWKGFGGVTKMTQGKFLDWARSEEAAQPLSQRLRDGTAPTTIGAGKLNQGSLAARATAVSTNKIGADGVNAGTGPQGGAYGTTAISSSQPPGPAGSRVASASQAPEGANGPVSTGADLGLGGAANQVDQPKAWAERGRLGSSIQPPTGANQRVDGLLAGGASVPSRSAGVGGLDRALKSSPAHRANNKFLTDYVGSQIDRLDGIDRDLAALQPAERTKYAGVIKRLSADRVDIESMRAAASEDVDAVSAISSALSFVSKTKVYAYEGDAGSDGFFDGRNGAVFFNTSNPLKSLRFTLMHEAQHVVRNLANKGDQAAIEATKILDDVYENLIPQSFKDDYADKNSDVSDLTGDTRADKLRNEITSEFMGSQADNPKFWDDLAKSNPTRFRAFVDHLEKVVEKVLKAIGKMGGRGPDGDWKNPLLKQTEETLTKMRAEAVRAATLWADIADRENAAKTSQDGPGSAQTAASKAEPAQAPAAARALPAKLADRYPNMDAGQAMRYITDRAELAQQLRECV